MSRTKNSEGMAARISFRDLHRSPTCQKKSRKEDHHGRLYHGIGVYAGSASSEYFSVDAPMIVDKDLKHREG